jgi:hypothetical protein
MSIFDYITGLNPHLQQNEMIKNIAMPRMNMSNEDYNVISAMNAADNMNSGLMTLSAPATLYSLGDYAKNLYSDAVNQGYMGSPEITDTDIPVDGNFPEFKRSQDFRETMGDLGRYLKGVNIQSNPELAKQLMGEDYVNKMQGKYALAMDEIGQGIFGIGPDPSLYGSPSGITAASSVTQKPKSLGFDTSYGVANEPDDTQSQEYIDQVKKSQGGGIGGLLKFLVGLAVPGAGFLMNLPGRGLEGIRSLNQRIQGSDFGQATSLTDYLDMRKYGGAQGRRDASARTMAQARGLQKQIDQRPSAIGGGGGGGGRDMGASASRSAAATRSRDLGSMRGGVGR